MLERNRKYKIKKSKPIIKTNTHVWVRDLLPSTGGKYLYKSNCSMCGVIISSQKSAIFNKTGLCRSCVVKKVNQGKVETVRQKLARQKAERAALKAQEIEMKKEKTLGEKILDFDNSDGTVATFNRIFNEVLGGDQTDELTILAPYTHYGREIERKFADGTLLEFRFLFDDEPHVSQNRKNNKVWDIFRKSDNKILYTYRSLAFLARDLQTDLTTVRTWNEKGTPTSVNITIVERAI